MVKDANVDETESLLQEDCNKEEAHEKTSLEDDLLRIKEEFDVARQNFNQAEENLKETEDKLVRSVAEMENIRKRSEREIQKARKYSIEKFAKELLAVFDSLEQAENHQVVSDEAKAMKDGISMTLQLFLTTVGKFGLEQINPLNEKFDPNLHEAIAMCPNDDIDNGYICDVFQKGYILNGRVIRPARVVVVKK